MADFPDRQTLPLNAAEEPDRTSWGYRLLGQLNYNGLFGGLNLRPRLVFTHDVVGTTPAPQATFLEDRKSATLGVSADYTASFIGRGRFFLEVTEHMPRTFGRNQLHVSQVEGWCRSDRPLVEVI